MVECLSSMHEARGLIPNTHTKPKQTEIYSARVESVPHVVCSLVQYKKLVHVTGEVMSFSLRQCLIEKLTECSERIVRGTRGSRLEVS